MQLPLVIVVAIATSTTVLSAGRTEGVSCLVPTERVTAYRLVGAGHLRLSASTIPSLI